MDEFARAQQHQARDEVKGCRESLDAFVGDLTNFRALLEETCDDLADAGMKTIDLKRKADDAHGRTCSHRDRCRRATEELETAEEVLNNNLGCQTGTTTRRSTSEKLSHLTPATPSAGRGFGSDLTILGANPRRE